LENEKRLQELLTLGVDKETFSLEYNMLSCVNKWILNVMKEKDLNGRLLREEPIYKELHNADTPILKDTDYKILVEVINKHYPHFLSFIEKSGKLTPENIQTAYLIKAQLSQNEMMRLLGNKSNTVSMRIKSLAKKIYGEDIVNSNWNKDVFSYILDI
jgi:DNA-binding CsgD family transcriptional regulator